MPTRPGWTVLVGAIVAIVLGRFFGILELYVIGAGLACSVALAVLAVHLVRPRWQVARWVHPSVLTVGDVGRTDLLISNTASLASPGVELFEPVGPSTTAAMSIGPVPGGGELTASYRIPAQRRGLLEVGPTMVRRSDLLGLAATESTFAGSESVVIAPPTIELEMPSLGNGVLGRHLVSLAQRLGAGEFHSLRDYVAGDEPRSIHWKASARSEDLKVRQNETQGVRRCVVVLDADRASYAEALDHDPDTFERAVIAAASLTTAADRFGLTTRFVTHDDIDVRGPHVGTQTLRELALVDLGGPIVDIERDPGEGLGLLIVITTAPTSPLWNRFGRSADPALTSVGVFVDGGARSPLHIDARSIDELRSRWQTLTGTDRSGAWHRERAEARGAAPVEVAGVSQ